MPKYINPYTDFGFKKLFGEEANKDLLIDFLNQILPPHHQIAELHFKNPENLPDSSLERKAIFDIHCIATSGERFIVEMQKAFQTAALAGLTPEQRDNYEQSLIQYWDLKSVIETAVEEAIEEKMIEIAKKLIKRGLSNEEIAEDTGLTIERVEQIRQEMRKN
ncbi:MAG: PD-(D/E)XK nuclease family transposase [Flammeovirgaceae bacterium]|nr:PD-(D/E)XK nuclease family transposase [Flammeovirgaceae bacterium]MDW8288080.1 PD-(D/E)XK nuclease family transposase [Flammeovirgaceae bacterium]